MTAPVYLVVPEGVDDPTMPSGGNVYDRRLREELTRAGWRVEQGTSLAGVPDGALALVDGLTAIADPAALEHAARRLRVVVLLHMVFGERDASLRSREQRVLGAARAVVTTSEWSRGVIVAGYAPSMPVHVAEPGVDAAEVSRSTLAGDRLLCVAAVTPDKGHDVLLAALDRLGDLPWNLTCVGSLDRDRAHAASVQRLGGDRVTWTGALDRDELAKAYAAADVTVLASRGESWGMVVTESLARGVPVVATEVGGVPEALGTTSYGRPGVLVPADDPAAVAGALRDWLTDRDRRVRLRAAAQERRTTLTGWSLTAAKVARVLDEVAR